MDLIVCDAEEKRNIKDKVIAVLEENDIPFQITDCCGSERICIDLNSENEACNKLSFNADIIVQTSNKDVCRIHPYEILYIAIENRKSVLYLTSGRVETNCLLNYWKSILDPKTFAQPHNSYIVNLNYVDEVTKDFVKVKYMGEEYSVYTSMRKIGAFKKAFLQFSKH